ncbi:hypothetical protein [Thermobacillus sp.]|uniref:hypothetical protein n=1 Tax=Thermobacillus sp. TaxID=2108467 RepID=UPI00257B0E9C|nr:hypothetical protein [Thermobacillus sp.]
MLPHLPSEGRLIRMGSHPKGGADGAEKREQGFPGLNPELAAHDDDAAGRRAAKAQDDAEMAAEFAAPDTPRERRQADGPANPGGRRSKPGPATSDAGRATGLFALAIAIASLFVWPLPLGLTAAVLGWFSFREGARGLGVWAVTIGLVAVLTQLVLIPIYAAWS